jgi:hypothetical protein
MLTASFESGLSAILTARLARRSTEARIAMAAHARTVPWFEPTLTSRLTTTGDASLRRALPAI